MVFGELLSFREITSRPSDLLLVRRFVRTCGAGALRSRFFLPPGADLDQLREQCVRYLTTGPAEGLGLLALVGGTPVGVLNLVTCGPQTAELGLVVAEQWQRLGIARSLVDQARALGRWTGWTVPVLTQWDNLPARRFVHSLPGPRRTVSVQFGVIETETHPFDLAPAKGPIVGPRGRPVLQIVSA